ncbi:MAG: hypothetical protein QXG00_02995 [Candidatus Woesearchaeota archaeon]
MLKQPKTMEELVYFTQRNIDNGWVKCWVFKEECPKCHKALMGKPNENGHIKIRAQEYICPNCNYKIDKKEYEETLNANIEYICPNCSFKDEIQIPFKRKTIMGVQTLRFQCKKCNEKIDITKKMKKMKNKKTIAEDEDAFVDE